MNKKYLEIALGVSAADTNELGKSDNMSTNELLKICRALNCDISDILEIEKQNKRGELQ